MKNEYKESKTKIKVSYDRRVRDDGKEIEAIFFEKRDPNIITNPKDHSKLYEKILQLLKGTGISKITITFFDTNL